MFASPRGWSAEEDSDDDGPPVLGESAKASGSASPPESWAALVDVGGTTGQPMAGPTRRIQQQGDGSAEPARLPGTASAKPRTALLDRLATHTSGDHKRQFRPRRAKSAGAARTKPSFTRGAALTDATAPSAPTPELVAEGTSTVGDRTPRDDQRPWLQMHKDHSTRSPVVAQVADSEMLSYMSETFTFWHSHGHEAKWMLMRLGSDALCSTKPMGWVLASELVLRNQDPDESSLFAFLSTVGLDSYAHRLRGLGVADVESLALRGGEIVAEAGFPAPARRMLRRALTARTRELEMVEDTRRRERIAAKAQAARCEQSQTAADCRTSPGQDPPHAGLRFKSAASFGIGEDWFKGQRPSARTARSQRQRHSRSNSPTRPSTAPPRSSSLDDSAHGSSPPPHRQGFVGSASSTISNTSLGVMRSVAAHAVQDRIGASGSWPQDTRRFSGGGFALCNRKSSDSASLQSSSEQMLNNHVLPERFRHESGSLSQVVLSSASEIVSGEDDSVGANESRSWSDSVETANLLRRANKARSAVKTQSSFGRVGMRPQGTEDDTPLQPETLAYVADDPTLLGPKPLPHARPGYVWCARPGGGYAQMTVAQRKNWLDERMRCGDPVPAQVDPLGQPLPATVRGEAARDVLHKNEVIRGGSASSGRVSTWQLQEARSSGGERERDTSSKSNLQPGSCTLAGPRRQQRSKVLHSRSPPLVQVHITGARRRQRELRRRGLAARPAGLGRTNLCTDNGEIDTSGAMHQKNARAGLPVRSVQLAHDLVWNGQAVYA